MKEIELINGYKTIVDDEDFEKLQSRKWYILNNNNRIYAKCKQNKKVLYMHRVIMNVTDSKICVDHINGNTLDNRKENLRLCSISENTRNSPKQKNNTSGFKGVFWNRANKKWIAQIMFNYKSIYLGLFIDPIEAAQVYDRAAIKYHGEFANLNFPKENYENN